MEPWRVLREKHSVTTWGQPESSKQTIWISPTFLFYVTHCFKDNQRVWNHEGKESDTIWIRENLPTFLLYSFTITATKFLPSCLPLLTVYKYWRNLADLVEVSLNSSFFCALFFCLMFFVSLFTFWYDLFRAMVWMIVMVVVVFNWCSVFWFNTDRSCKNTTNRFSFDLYGLLVVVCAWFWTHNSISEIIRKTNTHSKLNLYYWFENLDLWQRYNWLIKRERERSPRKLIRIWTLLSLISISTLFL